MAHTNFSQQLEENKVEAAEELPIGEEQAPTHEEKETGVPSPASTRWDHLSPDERREQLTTLASHQYSYLLRHVEFYRREPVYKMAEVRELGDMNPAAIGGVPILSDTQVVNADEENLIPDDEVWFHNYGTGGTSGRHKNVLDSRNSWYTSVRRMANTVTEMESRAPELYDGGMTERTVFNTYNAHHVTAEILNRVVNVAGGKFYQRKLDQSAEDMLREMEELGVDMLVCPGKNPESNKGGSIENLLRIDGEDGYIANNVERIWYSSTGLREEDRAVLEANDITIESWYGNTEARAFGYAPPQHPGYPHIMEGQYLVTGFDDSEGTLERSGEGLVLLVSAVAQQDDSGNIEPHTGTGFFNYQVGVRTDINPAGECPYHDDCPLTTRTIDMDTHGRVETANESALGCEAEGLNHDE